MSERVTPQRWMEPIAPPTHAAPRGAAHEVAHESILAVALQFLALVRRNWRVVLGTTALALVVAFVLIRLDQPIYRAKATIRFDDKGSALARGIAGGPQQMSGPITDPLLTQIQVLQSRGVANEVVDREGLRLVVQPASLADGWVCDVRIPDQAQSAKIIATFTRDSYVLASGGAAVRAPYGTPARIRGIELTIIRHPEVETATLDVIPLDRAADGVMSRLVGRARERTDIIDVNYESSNPVVAQRVVNTAVHAFQDLNAQKAKQESVRRRKFIEDQLSKTETLLSEAEASHNQFRSRERVFSSQDKLRSQQADLTGIELRRRELSADRGMYASLLAALRDPRRTSNAGERMNALVSSPGIANNAVVAALYAQLSRLQASHDSLTTGPYAASASNPDLARINGLIASTNTQIVGAVRGQIAAADARLAALDQLQARSAGTMSTLPTTEAEEAGLLAQVETYRKEAERLREELQKAQIEEAAQAGQIDIVDLATLPRHPIGTGRTPRLVLALVLGLVIGSLIAYIIENYSAVIRRREDVERVTSSAILAIVPPFQRVASGGNRLLPWRNRENGRAPVLSGVSSEHPEELVTVVDVRSHAAESYRTLRTNLLFSTAVRSLRHLIVTSAGPAEGKSTTAANLAVAFAQQGKRVLLVDCDLRRPRLHKVFQQPQIPGLTNALLGGTSHAELIHATGVENLWFMAAGPTPPSPVELLGSEKMGAIIRRFSESYDLLMFDTPPVLVASDASILSRHVDGTLFVVRAGRTQSAALRDGLERLGALGTHVLGTVINDPDGEVAKFASYYGYYYTQYYEATPA